MNKNGAKGARWGKTRTIESKTNEPAKSLADLRPLEFENGVRGLFEIGSSLTAAQKPKVEK